MEVRIRPARSIRGEVRVPGDKSISHRALLLGALARGESVLQDLSPGADVQSTARCLRALGVSLAIEFSQGNGPEGPTARVQGVGLSGLSPPASPLDAGNSGTTLRLLAGVLAGQPFESVLTGDASLRRRPMGRVIEPLTQMGACIESEGGRGRAPLRIRGGRLRGIRYKLPVPSAQVKSCLLLAGLFADGETTVIEPVPTRDHTERLLRGQGAPLGRSGPEITLRPCSALEPLAMRVPGDLSSAAFWIAAATLVPGSELAIRGVGLNPTRTGFLAALQRMGACISVGGVREEAGEPVGDLLVRGAERMQAVEIGGEEVPTLVDEVPLLAVVATQAEGTTVVRDAEELRVKETDRLRAVAENLRRMGVFVEELPDGLVIPGPQPLRGACLPGYGDHRIVMAFAVAGLIARGETTIEGAEWVDISYPGFFEVLSQIVELR